MRLSRRFTLAMATVALVLYFAQPARSDEPALNVNEPILIIPAAKLPAVPSIQTVDAAGVPVASVVNSAEYRRIYRSIPFSRAEYRVNPNYRHDSTMEILTGIARHQTIVQHNHEHKQPVQRVPVPARPSRILTPFTGPGYYHWGTTPWFGYGFPW